MRDTEKFKIYQRVFNTEEGKVVLEDLERISGLKEPIYNDSANKLYYLEGRRSLVCDIREVVYMSDTDMAKYIKIEKEQEEGALDVGNSYDPNKQ